MPYLIPVTVKIAMTVGAITGATIAFINNKERVLETTEFILQKGADFCRQKLEEAKHANMHFADAYEDDELSHRTTSEPSTGHATGSNSSGHFSDYDEATTPEASDFSDEDEFYDDDLQDAIDTQSLD
ncbi:uncharacterized protein RJT20DRAFT_124399 [Scheffersomyces xylosifermentans]|uniref:uncharacterized protein n=1 Tax=Scheffersomyces xylosifermentans TaxID=1304137 RepID=UPI00315CF958